MTIVKLLTDPEMAMMRDIYLTAALAGLSVVVMCGVLSVLVVVKRLGFVGQGVSHSAFGGIGVVAILGAVGVVAPGSMWEFGIIALFCIAAALGMAAVSDKRTVPVDTAIGMFLVGSMALGAILVQISRPMAAAAGNVGMVRSWESILFGSVLTAGWGDVAFGWTLCVLVLAAAWWVRRPLLFWSFDEESARAFGVSGAWMKVVLMVLLSVAVVTAMRLAGVVLATALLVLPGATALKLSDRLWRVVGLSVAVGAMGLLMGLSASLELDWQPGPSVVLAMTVLFGLVTLTRGVIARRA